MTIVVGATTPDGIVLAADSRTTFSEGERHRVVSDNAQKIFPVGRMGVATAGDAFIGTDTIAGTMDRFIAQVGSRALGDFDRFLHALGEFFDERFKRHLEANGETWDVDELGYPIDLLVGGYDSDGVGHLKELLIPGPTIGEFSADTLDGGTMWRGQTDVIGRLLKGVDWNELARSGEPLPPEQTERLEGLAYNGLSPITVQDCVDYTTFLVRTTIDMQRFSDGIVARPGLVPGCGGPIHALVIERGGTSWASPSTREHWQRAEPR